MNRLIVRRVEGEAEVMIVPDAAALAFEAAARIAALAREAVESRGRFSLALSGGSTPGDTYRLLAEDPPGGPLPWPQIHLFWGDERCVPPGHAASNYHLAHEALLRHVPIPAANVHRVRGELAPQAAVLAYEQEMEDYFCGPRPRFDLVLLGLGSDGHTAALFPGSATLEQTEGNALAVEGHYRGRPAARVTLALPAINAARQILFLVSGGDKAEIVAAVLGSDGATLPAQQVWPVAGGVAWLLDQAAAAHLAANRDAL